MTAVTSQGFVRTRLDERLAALQAAMRAIFGEDINLEPDSIDGQTLGIYAESISNLDQLAEDIYQGFSPQSASGLALSRLVQLNGLLRIPGSLSTVTLTAIGTPGTVILANSSVGSLSYTDEFRTIADAIIPPSGEVSIPAQSAVIGPVTAPAGTLTEIKTPIFGWQSVTNASDAIPGRAEETDEQLRQRRALSTSTPAQAIVDAIFGALANLPEVRQVRVFENPEDITDANGLPPHSIYCVVDGGEPLDIGNAIWLKKSAGCTLKGDDSVVITDSQGNPHTMRYSRPQLVQPYITINLTTRAGWPTDGAQRIRDALVAWSMAEQAIGEELIYSRLYTPINSVPGHTVDSLLVGLVDPAAGTASITVAIDELIRIDSARITVNVSTP